MVYDRGGYRDRSERQDGGQSGGSGREFTYSSARDYQAAGDDGRERSERDRGRAGAYDGRQSGYFGGGGGDPYRGSYASDGRRFAETGRDDRDFGRDRDRGRDYGRDRDDDRGFFERAGDEVRSWFSDDDDRARGRGDYPQGGRRVGANRDGDRVHDHRDRHYHSWREGQIAALDRDYDEYRREHQSKFENEFSSWRTGRQSQRQMLESVDEHMEVTGSDGEHVGTVDKVRGDRIILTKNDKDAGGRHHSIPSSWLRSVEGGKVMLSRSSTEAKSAWRDEERQGEYQGARDEARSAMFGRDDREQARTGNDDDNQARDNQGRMLNRSFSGTY